MRFPLLKKPWLAQVRLPYDRKQPADAAGVLRCALAASALKNRFIKTDGAIENTPMRIFRLLALPFVALLFSAALARADNSRCTILMTLTQSDYGGGRIYPPVRFGNVMGTMRLDAGASPPVGFD